MSKRPVAIAIIGWLYIAVGVLGLVRGLWPLMKPAATSVGTDIRPQPILDSLYVSVSGLIAGLGGALLIRGCHWARWLLVVWMVFHVLLSLLHSVSELAVHCVLFGTIFWFLFRPQATAYLRNGAVHSA